MIENAKRHISVNTGEQSINLIKKPFPKVYQNLQNNQLKNMEAVANHRPTLLLNTCKGIEVININTIIRIEGSSNYSKLFFLNGKTLVVAKLLKWFEEKLVDAKFIRIHKTHFINTDFVLQYAKGAGGKVELTNGEWVTVSKRRKGIFVKRWMDTTMGSDSSTRSSSLFVQ